MDILANATKHWQERIDTEFIEILVPEWGKDGEPAKLYFGPANLAQRTRIDKAYEEKGAHAAFVETIITRAKNADGSKAFIPNNQTRDTFAREIDPDVVVRIVSRLNEAFQEPTVEEAGKN